MNNNKQKPVTLLTGFLGAGKTTLLNAYLTHHPDVRFAIVENEIGEEGIDGELVLQSADTLVEMNNGCICCTLNDNFYDILDDLSSRDSTWDELLIEATGIADPAGIALPFLSNPTIAQNFKLQRVICLIDVSVIEDQLRETEEAVKQIAFSDVLLLNKTDQVQPEYLNGLQQMLEKINPMAQVLRGCIDNYPLDEISAFVREQDEEELPAHGQGHHRHHEDHHPHDHDHHHWHSDIHAISFTFTEPFDADALAHRLNVFLLFQSSSVYRAKGIFYDPEESRKVIVQSVGNSLLISPGKVWKEGEEKVSRMVFIGKKLIPKGFEKMLRQCIRKTLHTQ
ncbi:GTP-binding protein [Fulvivirga ulvae]|uniref:CobW family GTP-binding protein n=1 Tax=Fulvivirga ulvae TaxID=2904245 RepID=UPI001F2B31A1|nr:GTP-binding protein [Fulvivirga ulvae]UII30263.1 GTP-binding protein [Fulvivirga ulvae]